MKKRIAYLGDLEEVAQAIKSCDGVERVFWIAGNQDNEALEADRRVGNVRELEQALKELGPFDLGVIANFGIILSKECLSIPKEGFINAHMGLLPQYPGRLPIRSALEKGESVVGVTLHRVTEKVDEGPIIQTKLLAAGQSRDAHEIFDRMTRLIPDMIIEFLLSFC